VGGEGDRKFERAGDRVGKGGGGNNTGESRHGGEKVCSGLIWGVGRGKK